jgi:hypothetical protein
MPDIYQEIVRIRAEGGEAAVVTIISAVGSTPREEGAKSCSAVGARQLQSPFEMYDGNGAPCRVYIFNLQSQGLTDSTAKMEKQPDE